VRGSAEGEPVWLKIDRLSDADLVQDLPHLIPRALGSYRGDPPFSAVYTYDASGALEVHFTS
jgi:hypothetical protein